MNRQLHTFLLPGDIATEQDEAKRLAKLEAAELVGMTDAEAELAKKLSRTKLRKLRQRMSRRQRRRLAELKKRAQRSGEFNTGS